MLGWSQAELAKAGNVSRQTIADFERGAHMPIGNNLASMIKAFPSHFASVMLLRTVDKKITQQQATQPGNCNQ
ncbi:helix-turn-helix transcriptional regulator [Phyllobacterium sp. YR531]|uniref:helix-turn-helix domain-containing protein n=1 Tax=Phyllobacterium sp. YR531 TaxID=1144343 RepID=UPI00026FA965|nr:helix-turn-helix transcriptional regulator [Phyllobacterium sp. YR531]EJN05974.1 putative transcriptional regulator [Phyllobacterium sp. YR531]